MCDTFNAVSLDLINISHKNTHWMELQSWCQSFQIHLGFRPTDFNAYSPCQNRWWSIDRTIGHFWDGIELVCPFNHLHKRHEKKSKSGELCLLLPAAWQPQDPYQNKQPMSNCLWLLKPVVNWAGAFRSRAPESWVEERARRSRAPTTYGSKLE